MQVSSKTIMAAISLAASSQVYAAGCANDLYQFECTDVDVSDVVNAIMSVPLTKAQV